MKSIIFKDLQVSREFFTTVLDKQTIQQLVKDIPGIDQQVVRHRNSIVDQYKL